jgi:hypothetical protein
MKKNYLSVYNPMVHRFHRSVNEIKNAPDHVLWTSYFQTNYNIILRLHG